MTKLFVLFLCAVLGLGIAGYAAWSLVKQDANERAKFLDLDSDGEREKEERGIHEGEEDDDPDGRANWFMYQRMYPFEEKFPEDGRRRAFDEVMARGEGFGPNEVGTTWMPIGPAPQTSAFPNNGGFTSGRINAIAVSSTDNQIVLIGSASGGIWRSTNGGTTFTPVSDTQADLAVGAIGFAPSDGNIVYAGMGDLDNGYFGTGVLKSTDAGATWTRVNSTGFPDRGNCTGVKVDPTDPDKVFVTQYNFSNPATGGTFISGVYLSTNGGVTWTNVLSSLASDIAFHPTNPQIVYAGIRFRSNAVPGLYRSTDGGSTWARVYDSPYTTAQSSTRDFRVAVTPAAPNRVYIYYGTRDFSPFQARLEVSDDMGITWSNRGVISNAAGGIDPGQFGYNSYLAASPVDANTVYVGSRDVFRSTNSGATFTDLSNSFAAPWPNGSYTPFSQKFHSDQQSFAFEPGSGTTFYCGSDGGIWKTTNGGTNFASMNSSLSLTQFVSIGINPVDPTKSYGGAQDNGSQRRTGGVGWTEFSSGDGGKLVIDPVDPTVIYSSYVNGSISRFFSNGVTFSGTIASAALLGETGTTARIAFYPPIVGNGTNSKIYTGTWRLLRCDTCNDPSVRVGSIAPVWTPTGGTFDQTTGGSDILTAIAVSKSNNQIIYTGSRSGRAMVSSNGGAIWTDITTGLPVRAITSITVSPTNPALVYLTVSSYGSGHVFRSTNSGAAWTDISSNLPNIPVSAFLIDPITSTTFYAGTDIGVFRSTDSGATWAPFNNGLPPVPVMEFASLPTELIQIATYGRGAYELPTVLPTSVTVAGRVTSPDGRGLKGATVSLIDSQNIRKTAATNPFGLFSFTNVAPGPGYLVNVSSKQYRFQQQSPQLTGDITLPDFIGVQ